MYLPGSSPDFSKKDYPDYVQLVKNLNRFVDFARILIQKVNPPSLPEIDRIDYYRGEYLKIFSKQEQVDFSYQVHKEGGCLCCYQNYPPIQAWDILYLLMKNPAFRFPEPDLESLGIENTKKEVISDLGQESKCVFLGLNGCQLRNNRPAICLVFIGCKGLSESTRGLIFKLKESCRGSLVLLYSLWWKKFIEILANSKYAEYIKEKYHKSFIFFEDVFWRLRFAAEHFSEFNEKELRVFGDAMSLDEGFWKLVDRIARIYLY